MDKNAIYQTKVALIERNLGKALKAIQPIMSDRFYAELHERIRKIDDDYRLMLAYLRQGYPDPSRDKVYLSLLRKLDRLTNEASLQTRIAGDSRMMGVFERNKRVPLNVGLITRHIEDYVSELALTSLEEGDASSRSQELHQAHHQHMSAAFEQICLSGQWHAGDLSAFVDLVLSPTTDMVSAALIVSAITLSSITYFDVYKYQALARIYREAEDETIRQRALVGWALTTTRTHALYPEVAPLVEEMTGDRETAAQLLELQSQLFFCINAERDQDEIRRDIMPNLMKNKGFEITRHGIVEKDDDPMQDILDPEASDRAMEELERSFQRMSEMQRSGSDIYFGGFSQMKRYPFFYTLSNWFCPFYSAHPGLSVTQAKLQGQHLLQALTSKGLFCDSDKYSFALALATVIDRLPDSMKTAINEGAAFGDMMNDEQLHSPSTIRLLYLQDLYRFFRISDFRHSFYNPFGGNNSLNALFLCSDILKNHVAEHDLLRFGNFLLKRHHLDALEKLLSTMSVAESAPLRTLEGYCLLRQGKAGEAFAKLQQAIALDPDNRRALSGYARAAMQSRHYDEAEKAYCRLCQLDDTNTNYIMGHALALLNNGKAQEASALLYRLNYEQPEDQNISRVLAWCLLLCQKGPQAQKIYDKLLDTDQPLPEDYLNAGYSLWINGQMPRAIEMFETYLQKGGGVALHDAFMNDKQVLLTNGITLFEIQMMGDLVTQSA